MEEQDRITGRPDRPRAEAMEGVDTVVAVGFDELRWSKLDQALRRTLPWARRRLVDHPSALGEVIAPVRARGDTLLVVPERLHGRPAVDWVADLREQRCAAPVILVAGAGVRLEELSRCSPLALLDAAAVAAGPLRTALLHLAHIDRLQRNLRALHRSMSGVGEDNLQLARNLREASQQLADKAVDEELQEAAAEPPLVTRVEARVRQARTRGEALSCVLLRLEGLADLEDAYEPSFVDFVLVQAAHRLKRRVRSSDLVARYGRRSFVVLSGGLTAEKAVAQVRRLGSALTTERFGHLFLPKVSIGLAFLAPAMAGARELLQAAEKAVTFLGTWGGREAGGGGGRETGGGGAPPAAE